MARRGTIARPPSCELIVVSKMRLGGRRSSRARDEQHLSSSQRIVSDQHYGSGSTTVENTIGSPAQVCTPLTPTRIRKLRVAAVTWLAGGLVWLMLVSQVVVADRPPWDPTAEFVSRVLGLSYNQKLWIAGLFEGAAYLPA